MLGHPAFVAAHGAGDAEGEAFFSKEGIAAVTGAVGPDAAFFGEVDDVLGVAAGPGDVFFAFGEGFANAVEAGDKGAFVTELFEDGFAHAGHDAHVRDDVGRVGDFHPDHREGGAEGSHAERHDVHRAARHAAVEEAGELGLHLVGRHPVVGGAGVVLAAGADERAVLDASDVGGVGPGEVAVGAFLGVELFEGATGDEQVAHLLILFSGAVAPADVGRFAELGHFFDPSEEGGVCSHGEVMVTRNLRADRGLIVPILHQFAQKSVWRGASPSL